jgi:hypothetical protein
MFNVYFQIQSRSPWMACKIGLVQKVDHFVALVGHLSNKIVPIFALGKQSIPPAQALART